MDCRGGHRVGAWHVLRHSFASNLASAGVDQRKIDRWMGHSTDVRLRYQHLRPEDQQEDIAVLYSNKRKPGRVELNRPIPGMEINHASVIDDRDCGSGPETASPHSCNGPLLPSRSSKANCRRAAPLA